MAEVVSRAEIPLTEVKGAGATTRRDWPTLGEDWLAVWLGGFSIGLVLAGVRPTLPAFVWAGVSDLTHRVLGPQNLINVLIAGALVGSGGDSKSGEDGVDAWTETSATIGVGSSFTKLDSGTVAVGAAGNHATPVARRLSRCC